MPDVPKDYVIPEGERAIPILWAKGPFPLPVMPDVSDKALSVVFGDGNSKRLKSWGHDENGVHWLVTRSGTSMHRDTTFTRYTHHLVLRNDGFRIRGWDDKQKPPPLRPGHLVCLDTHSPHQVVIDERLENPRPLYKVQIAIDADEPLDPVTAWNLCATFLRRDPAKDAPTAKFVAPRGKGYKPPKDLDY